ncbi:hypothetical protein MMC30_005073 [Trapelia coarctata]|nr:hypothetical protein [Trapelia coarctata]
MANIHDPKYFKKPSFNSLPLRKDGPHGNAWGLFSDRDQLGMLNLLTADTTISATKEIVHGIRISTDLPLNFLKTPMFKRQGFHQEIIHKTPRTVNDDVLTFNTQSSSQWDGFRHYGYQEEKVYFNGLQQEDVHNTLRNGIHVWVENGGIVGRGVLLDYDSWAEAEGIPHPVFENTSIPLSHLLKVAESQNVAFRPGDILFIRSGFTRSYNFMSSEDIEIATAKYPPSSIGVQQSEEMLRWIWDTGFAAVAGDMPAFETTPFQNAEHFLHEWLLAGWGVPIGELFDLERLAVECRKAKKWSFFFSSMPLHVPGGVASPPNGVAIL